MERWKRGSVRDEAGDDINSIMSDLQTNLPPLLKDADGAPGSLSKALPLAKHVDALYDVLLRVVEAARMAAPDDQANELRQALNTLGSARFALDDRMLQTATTQEKQIADLHMTVEKQAAFKCPAPPPPPECPKTPVRRPVRKKAAATPPTGTQQGTPQKAPATNGSTPQKGQQPQGAKGQSSQQKPSNQQPASGSTPKTGP